MKRILVTLIAFISFNAHSYFLDVKSEDDCTQLYNMDENELVEDMKKPDFQIQDLITECQTKFNNKLTEESINDDESLDENSTKSNRKPASNDLPEESDTVIPFAEGSDAENKS